MGNFPFNRLCFETFEKWQIVAPIFQYLCCIVIQRGFEPWTCLQKEDKQSCTRNLQIPLLVFRTLFLNLSGPYNLSNLPIVFISTSINLLFFTKNLLFDNSVKSSDRKICISFFFLINDFYLMIL